MKILGVERSGIMMSKTAGLPQTARRVFEGWWHRWYFIQSAFNRWNGERNVNVRRNDVEWFGLWFFAGVRNSFHFSPEP